MPLNARQLKFLRQLAQQRKPVVSVGNRGLTAAVMAEIHSALKTHELLKIKLPAAERAARVALFTRICTESDAQPVQHIGRMAILYRPSDKPKIQLPG